MASRLAHAILLGQLLALLIAATASASTALAAAGVSLPALQSAAVYALLAAVYGGARLASHGLARPLARPWWQYAALAALDVEANYLVVTAFRHTSITSVTLLDCWSIPVALALTRALGLAAYRRGHVGGAALCVLGLALLLAGDRAAGGGGGSAVTPGNNLLGDLFVVLGASLYAGCNVLQEHLLGDVDPGELLAMLGAFGAGLSLVQGLALEAGAAAAAPWTLSLAGPWAGYAAAMFSFYSLVPYELEWGGAAILNLSLLSSDLWTAAARLAFFGGFSAPAAAAFAAAFVFVAAGIALYSASGEAKRGGGGDGGGGGGYKRVTGICSDEYFGVIEGGEEAEEGEEGREGSGSSGARAKSGGGAAAAAGPATELVATPPSAREGVPASEVFR